ncbi:uncharacterized protein AB675_8073 [Cyphellophora attinorum]|uniref:Uncharacterized protein n=1 Tax=Cyphellophora attinorum TaxID=1664694 RepID=A0A0N1HC53_9EURO|nr:uncharacterized protein AB675_8073 [Phialophora attinorum]KPI41233.1 hypothetical protein AB675_8073 [Phialophora attinorum]
MSSRSSQSSRSSSASSSHSTGSQRTYKTNLTSHSDVRPGLQHYDTAPAKVFWFADDLGECPDGQSDPRSSAETYASTVSPSEDLGTQPEYELPQDRPRVFDSEAIPSTPSDFSKLFPTTRRLLIQHDDTTSDGNMNIRVDTEALSPAGERLKMTIFHLRMKNLYERQFSLRRYCRDSGREVCNSTKKYVKPLPPGLPQQKPPFSRSITTALHNLGRKRTHRQDADSDSEDGEDLEHELRNFTLTSEVKADIPTNTIRLEFSNYAQVELHRRRGHAHSKQWDFEYWGEPYSWQRDLKDDDGDVFYTYDLINLRTGAEVAHILPDKLEPQQAALECRQGSWIPPSSMRLRDGTISADLADVIVSTGLTAMVDDCIKRRWHSRGTVRLHAPSADAKEYLEPEEIVDRVFPRRATNQRR